MLTNLKTVERKNIIRWWIVVFIIIFLSDLLGISQFVKLNFIGPLMKPFADKNTKLVLFLAKPFYDFRHMRKASQKVQDLEYRYAEASAQLSEIDTLRSENKALRELLENSDRKLGRIIIAAPVLSFAQPVISVGSEQKVKEGMIVLVANTMIGIVDKVDEQQSQITLLLQRSLQPILAETESNIQGLIKGDGRKVLLTELPIDADIEVNERIVTSGQKGIDKDIFIGRVKRIEFKPSDSSKTAVIEQYVSFYETAIVEVKGF